MKKYLINRLLLILPTLFVVSVVGFYLSKQVPQDPVMSLLTMRGMNTGDIQISSSDYAEVYRELNLQLPNFYFSITPANYPSNINAVDNPYLQEFYRHSLKKGMSFQELKHFTTYLSENNIPFESLVSDDLSNSLSKYPGASEEYKKISRSQWHWPAIHIHGLNNQYHHWSSLFLMAVLEFHFQMANLHFKKQLRPYSGL